MVKITCLNGIWAGRTCKFEGVLMVEFCERELSLPAHPVDLFTSFLRHNWRWEADYSEATEEEKLEWFRAELVVRIIRALERGLPVYFLGKEYRAQAENIPDVAQQLEDDIVASGMMVAIDSDDENGLVIGSERIQ